MIVFDFLCLMIFVFKLVQTTLFDFVKLFRASLKFDRLNQTMLFDCLRTLFNFGLRMLSPDHHQRVKPSPAFIFEEIQIVRLHYTPKNGAPKKGFYRESLMGSGADLRFSRAAGGFSKSFRFDFPGTPRTL